jgi:two-component system LytT family response regulator
MKIRTLIVDDEPLARSRIRSLAAAVPELEIVGECADGDAAIAAILEHRPDLVFLDVQMPEVDGFAVLRAVMREHQPRVVFVTAYDHYAVKAFDTHAVDYLLKPFKRKRFFEAVERVKHDVAAGVTRTFEDLPSKPSRLVIRSRGRVVVLKISDVHWIEAAENYVIVHTPKREYLVRESITNMEERLPAQEFIRVHRSAIVNVDRIAELRPEDGSDWVVVLHDNREIRVGRTHRAELFRALQVDES